MRITVRYQAGTYSGTRNIEARDTDEAIRIVRARIRKEMTLPMYSDSYEVVSVNDDCSTGLRTGQTKKGGVKR